MSNYKALYRKYRPQLFKDVSDQEYVTRTLQNAIKLGRISHAYLFNGPRGIGKTSIARIFAKAINCEHPNGAEPCDECDICKSITNGSNPDIIEIDAASKTRVENMRETLDKVNYLPTMSRYKVYIIDEVHMLSTSSFNALLKTLEEPPKHVVFILCTTEVEKVIPTIRSRCQRFDLHLISKEGLEERLKYVVKEEKINIEDKAISSIAEAAEGGMRDALSLLDQISAFSINDTITVDDCLEVSGKLSTDCLISIATSIIENDSSRAITLLDSLLKMGKEVEKITQSMINFYKDILVIKSTSKTIDKVGYDRKEFSDIVTSSLNKNIYRYIDCLTDAMTNYRFSTNKRLYLELALIKMCDRNELVELKPQNIENKTISAGASTSKPFDPNKKYPVPTFEKNTNSSSEDKEKEPEIKKENDETSTINNTCESEKLTSNDLSQLFIESSENENDDDRNDEIDNTTIASLEPKEVEKNYDIHYIEEALNNADKPFRENLIKEIENLKIESRGKSFHKYLMLFEDGQIVCSNVKTFIIAFETIGHCNLIMKEDNFNGIISTLKNELNYTIDFIAVPFKIWKEISDEYVRKYRANHQRGVREYINLTYIPCDGLRINKNEIKKIEEDKFKGIEDLFGDLITEKK